MTLRVPARPLRESEDEMPAARTITPSLYWKTPSKREIKATDSRADLFMTRWAALLASASGRPRFRPASYCRSVILGELLTFSVAQLPHL